MYSLAECAAATGFHLHRTLRFTFILVQYCQLPACLVCEHHLVAGSASTTASP